MITLCRNSLSRGHITARVALVLAYICLSSCASLTNVGLNPKVADATQALVTRASVTSELKQNLYVLTFSGLVERFPLLNGIPAREPSSTLVLRNSPSGGFAVDRTGAIYTSYYLINGQNFDYYVDVYAPGASGAAAPVRTVSVTNVDISELWVDQGGYLYVSGWRNGVWGRVDIFAPGPSASTSIDAEQPTQIIALPGKTYWPGGIATDAGGQLYVTSRGDQNEVLVYTDPTTAPVLTRTFCSRHDTDGVAIDDRGSVFLLPLGYRDPPGRIGIAEMSGHARDCPESALRYIGLRDQNIDGYDSIAVWGHYLYALAVAKVEHPAKIITFDANRGWQHPVEVIERRNASAFDAVVGP